MSIPKHIKEHAVLGVSGDGNNTYVVGSGGAYPATAVGFQSAINAALSKTQFTENLENGTLSINDKSRIVTIAGGDNLDVRFLGTDPVDNPQYISFDVGTVRTVFRIVAVLSTTQLLLDARHKGSSISGATWYTATPNMQVVRLLDDMLLNESTEIIYLTDDGTASGNMVPNAALAFDFTQAMFGGQINNGINSGVFIVEGLRSRYPYWPRFQPYNYGITIFSHPVDYIIKNWDVASWAGLISNGSDIFSRIEIDNLKAKTRHNAFLLACYGEMVISNVDIQATARYEDQTAEIQCLSLNLITNAKATVRDSRLVCAVHGSSDTISGNQCINLAAPPDFVSTENNQVTFSIERCSLFGMMNNGATEAMKFRLADVTDGMGDSDIHLTDVDARYIGDAIPTPGINWRNFALRSGTPPSIKNRLHIRNCTLLDLPTDWDTFEVVELVGDMGTRTASVTIGTVPAAEIDLLRASTHIVGPMTGAVTIPAPVGTWPTGVKIKFIISEDGAAGHAVTWNAAYKFHTAWTDSIATTDANKSTIVEFQFDGTNWIQVSPANVWL